MYKMKIDGTFQSTNFWTKLFVYGNIGVDITAETAYITYKGTYKSGSTTYMKCKWTGDKTAKLMDSQSGQILTIQFNDNMTDGTYVSYNPYDAGRFIFTQAVPKETIPVSF